MDEIWGITTYFNPAGYISKKVNHKIFKKSIEKQGLKILCVELAFGDNEFELSAEDADILIQLRAKDIMFQKERLLNLGLSKLPLTCKKIIWIDNDILFENNNWVYETSELLDQYYIVQPFEYIYKLKKNEMIPKEITQIPFGSQNGEKRESFAYGINNHGFSETIYPGHTGFCWAGRREVFDKFGFYDSDILGGGDLIMAHAFIGIMAPYFAENSTSLCKQHQAIWVRKVYKIVLGSINYTKGIIYHLYHGEANNRFYAERLINYHTYNFDPDSDIAIDEKSGTWIWNTDKPGFHKYCRDYFFLRKEDE